MATESDAGYESELEATELEPPQCLGFLVYALHSDLGRVGGLLVLPRNISTNSGLL